MCGSGVFADLMLCVLARERSMHVHPTPRTVDRGTRIAPLAFPNGAFAVDEFLPDPTR